MSASPSKNGKMCDTVAVAYANEGVALDGLTGEPRCTFESPKSSRGALKCIDRISVSPDGATIISVSLLHSWIQLFHAGTGELLKQIPGHGGREAHHLCTCATNARGKVTARDALCPLVGHSAGLRAAVFSPCGSLMASGGEDKVIIVWDIGGNVKRHLRGHGCAVTCLAFTSMGVRKLLASGGVDGQVRTWDADEGALITFRRFYPVVESLHFSHDGSKLAIGVGCRVHVWSCATWTETFTADLGPGHVLAVRFSPAAWSPGYVSREMLVATFQHAEGSALCARSSIVALNSRSGARRWVVHGHNGRDGCKCKPLP